MGAPAAKQGDQVAGVDIHIVMVPAVAPIPTPLPHPFTGVLDGALASSVKIMGAAAATQDSTASNTPAHIPTPPGVSFQAPPANKARVLLGSLSVRFAGKPAARAGDTAMTCNDPADLPAGTVVAAGTVLVGG
jgi:uncharacterized Zn-binding protein involved in type VI secretion